MLNVAPRELGRVFFDTRAYLVERLKELEPPSRLFVRWATPLILVRSGAVLLRGIVTGDIAAAFVLALGNFALQMGVWLAMGFSFPVLVRQFGHKVDDRQGFAIITHASVPLWLAGVLYAIPDEPPIVALWSRAMVALIGLYGVYVLYQSFDVLELRNRSAAVAATTVTFVVAYGFLFGLVGLSSTVLLLLLQSA